MQTHFDFFANKIDNYRQEDFVFLPEYQEVKTYIEEFVKFKLFDFNPYKNLIINGQRCSGKTHLLNIYANSHNLNFFNIKDLINKNPWHIFSANEFFVVDDFCLEEDEQKLLHLINCANESKSLLILLVRTNRKFRLADLNSRMENYKNIQIAACNFQGLKQIFSHLMSRKQIEISPQILEYIFANITLSHQSIVETAKKIEFYINENSQKLSLKLIKEIL